MAERSAPHPLDEWARRDLVLVGNWAFGCAGHMPLPTATPKTGTSRPNDFELASPRRWWWLNEGKQQDCRTLSRTWTATVHRRRPLPVRTASSSRCVDPFARSRSACGERAAGNGAVREALITGSSKHSRVSSPFTPSERRGLPCYPALEPRWTGSRSRRTRRSRVV